MSSSSAEPTLSIVVGSNGATASVEACLAALEPQVNGAEVLVCEPEASPPELRERFPFARFVDRPGALVPALWRDGIDASRGRFVALTISPMRPAADWVETIREQLERFDVVAGAVEPGERLRSSDWAEYFCRYSHDSLPFEPRVVVYQGRSAGAAAFVRQRLEHGREYGRRRGAGAGAAANLASAAASPLVPLVLTARLLRRLLRKGRFRRPLLVSLPLVLVFNAAWAAGEAAGRLDSLRAR